MSTRNLLVSEPHWQKRFPHQLAPTGFQSNVFLHGRCPYRQDNYLPPRGV